MERLDVNECRTILLKVVNEYSAGGNTSSFQSGSILREAARRLEKGGTDQEQILLTIWHDLFRTGYLAWGYNISNPNPPFCHVTDQGRMMLKQLSRDPSNPDGYLNYLSSRVRLSSVTDSYVREALQSFANGCYKASAVMIGTATESIVIEIREMLLERMAELDKKPSVDLKDWKIKRILIGLKRELDAKKKEMPPEIFEEYESYWPAFTQQIRTVRNDAGHPTDISSITFEVVHASLLIFHELVVLAEKIKNWIKTKYS